jgi:hypothetical protein
MGHRSLAIGGDRPPPLCPYPLVTIQPLVGHVLATLKVTLKVTLKLDQTQTRVETSNAPCVHSPQSSIDILNYSQYCLQCIVRHTVTVVYLVLLFPVQKANQLILFGIGYFLNSLFHILI